ncbi:hypothetical protein [Nocardia asteroides]|uniref:hypothetical protein n=1 Tax=Nocardia asteroides TaxID=1824 RepID=UPI00341F890D
MNADHATLVPALLQAAGITVTPDELAIMIAAAPGRAAAVESLYRVADARYEEPALIFRAVP